MKAARERVKKALTISTRKEATPSRKVIKSVSASEVAKAYKLGEQVMESTNSGMEVLFATRNSDGLHVVIKTRRKAKSFKSAQEEREWRGTTEYQLNMPTIGTLCQFYEVLETHDMYYVVMEKVEGKDLFEQMQQENIPHFDAREIVRQILDALNALHTEGRIHKDIKIENVMVDFTDSPKRKTSTTSGARTPGIPRQPSTRSTGSAGLGAASPAEVKLIDFDTVQDWEPSSPKARDVLGTDGYIAPEAYSGDYSPASDIYAAGVIMYKLLTGKFPSRPELFDDRPGENWVGSPAMRRIQDRLRTQIIDFTMPPLDRCPEAADLARRMLAFEVNDRPSADEALKHDWFLVDIAPAPRTSRERR